ncbi:MAG: hypothetical protein ACO3RG_04545, partial [Nitriliruptoraceae bacterium]
MADRPDVEAALAGLPNRTWALLLRELRSVLAAGSGDAARAELLRLLDGPRSAVATGSGRARVAGLLASAAPLRSVLAGRPPHADARAALDADAGPDVAAATGDAGTGDPTSAIAEPPGAEDGARELRAELARTRRQRDGAEARVRGVETGGCPHAAI